MGGFEFLASIVGSLARPGVVLVVLWYNRQRLANLLDWIEELTLPGGAKVKFVRALDKASVEAHLLKLKPDIARTEGRVDQLSDLATQFPEAAVVQSFIEVVDTLGQMVGLLALPTKARYPMSVIQELARLGYVDQKSVSLFANLRDGYTAAVRERYARLTPEEAIRFREAAQVLNAQLREILPRLEVDNPRKKEWGTS